MGRQQAGAYGHSGSYIGSNSSSCCGDGIGMLDNLDGQKILRKNFVGV